MSITHLSTRTPSQEQMRDTARQQLMAWLHGSPHWQARLAALIEVAETTLGREDIEALALARSKADAAITAERPQPEEYR